VGFPLRGLTWKPALSLLLWQVPLQNSIAPIIFVCCGFVSESCDEYLTLPSKRSLNLSFPKSNTEHQSSQQVLVSLRLLLCNSDKVGWSKRNSFRTPPAAGASEVKVVMYADMGKNERDGSNEHFLQVSINPPVVAM